jgi:hypothetical protein
MNADEYNARLRASMDSMVQPKSLVIKVAPEQGMKFDGGKRDFTLLPWPAVEEIVKVLEFGAAKYSRDNWKHVDDAEHRYTKAAFRHLIAYSNGEINDPESGLPHLAHVGCCILFLLALEKPE